jgi:hypothetical protein
MSDFDFTSEWDAFRTWAKENPGLVAAGISTVGTLIDPAQPSTSTVQQTTQLPDYLAPFVNRYLNRGEAQSNEAYIPYGDPRLADFNQDQQAAFQQYRDLNPNTPQAAQGSGIVGEAANRLLAQGGQRWDQSQADHYMSPYMQSVVDVQKREMQRDFDKQVPVMDAAAQRASAFGGDRHGIIQAEAQRNLGQRLGDIQTAGMQSAYTNAQGQFNADQNRQTTSLTGAAGAGNTLANIGQTQFQNQLASAQGLMGVGNQQQGLNQSSLNIGYQDFLNQRQHPYQQIDYARGLIQGLPVGQTMTANTGSAPSLSQQLISGGIGAYNMANQFQPIGTTPATTTPLPPPR